MNHQTYLIDTNVIIGLEDNHLVQPAFAGLLSIAGKHRVHVVVHDAARDDILRDKDKKRQRISLSKLDKFQNLKKVRGLTIQDLEGRFGTLPRANDIVDATLLDALDRGAADFLVTEDRGLHERARRHSPELGRRVLFVADAVQLLQTTYEPITIPVKYVEEVTANEIPLSDSLFDSLREDYADFDKWWKEKCVRERRDCWIIDDGGLAGIVVRKDETGSKTDATTKSTKILKICTMKVRPESRGIKLGELLLKKVFWFAQNNGYDLVYLTAYDRQSALLDLLEYYGFQHTASKPDGELIYERRISRDQLARVDGMSNFEVDRLNYPRFVADADTGAFVIPIKEGYHDTLFPELKSPRQPNLFDLFGTTGGPKTPGNTIRKVYLCRAQSNLGDPGALLFFYKGKSIDEPTQALTAIGIFEECAIASSTKELMQLTGGRSVYSERELQGWDASDERPVKVINFLLVGYILPPLVLADLQESGVFAAHPPQSIKALSHNQIRHVLEHVDLGFRV